MGLLCGGEWGRRHTTSRGGGAPPTPPPRLLFRPTGVGAHQVTPLLWPSAAPSTTRSMRRPGSPSRPSSVAPSPTASSWPKASRNASSSGGPATTKSAARPPSKACTRSRLRPAACASSSPPTPSPASSTAPGGSWCPPPSWTTPASARTWSSSAPRTPSRSGIAPPGPRSTPPSPTRSPTSPRNLVSLLDMTATHEPVLVDAVLEVLDPRPGDVVVDCTFGGGGHARRIAERLGPDGLLVGLDRDPVAEERFAELAADVSSRTRFMRTDFAAGLEHLLAEGLRADAVLMDLGMSSMQVDTWRRGFSYAYDAPLDMRMDPRQSLDAREILNTWDPRRLARVLREFGEERYANQIARWIVRARPLATAHELVDVIKRAVPAPS